MECPICMSNFPSYVIDCGSKTPHAVCEECEVHIRLKDKKHMVQCPLCRVTETTSGVRTPKSYEYELSQLYAKDENEPWALMAAGVRTMPREAREKYIEKYPKLREYFPISPTRTAVLNAMGLSPPVRITPREMRDRMPVREFVSEPDVRPSRRIIPVSPSSTETTSSAETISSTESEGRLKSIYCQGSCGMLTKHKCSLGCGRYVCESCMICLFH